MPTKKNKFASGSKTKRPHWLQPFDQSPVYDLPNTLLVAESLGTFFSSYYEIAQFAALIYLRWLDTAYTLDSNNRKPILPKRLQWRTWHSKSPKAIMKVLSSDLADRNYNENANPINIHLGRIAPLLERFSEWDPERLFVLVKLLAQIPLERASHRIRLRDELDELLLLRTSTTEHMTDPLAVVLIANLAKPADGFSIYDPCFGSAGLLTGLVGYVSGEDLTEEPRQVDLKIAGVELNPASYTVGLTRLALTGINNPNLELGNSLSRDGVDESKITGGFDLVVAEPPFNVHFDLPSKIKFPFPTNDSTSLFIQHAMSQLKPSGHAMVIVPNGILYRSGKYQKFREWLLTNHSVDSVIGLPREASLGGKGVGSSILLLGKEGPTKNVQMVDGTSGVLELPGEGGHADHLEIETSKDPEAPYHDSWIVSESELRATDLDLTPRRRDRSTLEPTLNGLKHKIEIQELGGCCDIMPGKTVPPTMLVDSPFAQIWEANQPPTTNLVEQPQRKEVIDTCKTLIDRVARNLMHFHLQAWAQIDDVILSGIIEAKKALKQYGVSKGENFETYAEKRIRTAMLRQTEKKPAPGGGKYPYIRIRDIQRGRVSGSPEKWAVSAALARGHRVLLEKGDVLISTTGTIGKAGLVDWGEIGGLASSGVTILRPNSKFLDSQFLVNYLNSQECQSWLSSWARGSAVAFISRKVIERLPVPIPNLKLQKEVTSRTDARSLLNYLREEFEETPEDPILIWLESTFNSLTLLGENETITLWDLFDGKPFGAELQNLAKQIKGYEIKRHDRLRDWVNELCTKVVLPLLAARTVDDPIRLVFSLESCEKELRQFSRLLRDQDSKRSFYANRISETVKLMLRNAKEELLQDVKIGITLKNNKIVRNSQTKIDLIVTNSSPLPISPIHITFMESNWEDSRTIINLEANEKCVLTFDAQRVEADSSGEASVRWVGLNIAGEPFKGSVDLAFDVIEPSKKSFPSHAKLGHSPYLIGRPVPPERSDVFFGRDELLIEIKGAISQSGNVIFLQGNKRDGKTSILHHLEGTQPIDGWLGIYVSCQAMGEDSTEEIFRMLASKIAVAVHNLNSKKLKIATPLPNGTKLRPTDKAKDNLRNIVAACNEGITDKSPTPLFEAYIVKIIDCLQPENLRLLILFDEFDSLQEGIDEDLISKKLPENLRYLVQTYQMCAVLTGSRILKRMRGEYWSPLYGIGKTFNLAFLDERAARSLIVEPVKKDLTYSEEAIKHAIFLTSGQPYLLQCLCDKIFTTAAKQETGSITKDIVQEAATLQVEQDQHFAELWTVYVGSDRRRVILHLCQSATKDSERLTLSIIQEKLAALGLEVSDNDITVDLEHLQELELIKIAGKGSSTHYKLSIPLMGVWIEGRDLEIDLTRARTKSD